MVQKSCTLEEKQKSIIGFLTISLQCFLRGGGGGGGMLLGVVLYKAEE